MERIFGHFQLNKGLVKDQYISFNLDRNPSNVLTHFPRPVILSPHEDGLILMTPGLDKSREVNLAEELNKTYKNGRKSPDNWGFKQEKVFYSFSWRSRFNINEDMAHFKHTGYVDEEKTSEIKGIYKRYRQHLIHCLSPGQVYYLPDREVVFFSNPHRGKKRYSRKVLVLGVDDQVTFIPLSTKLHYIDINKDILIDQKSEEPGLTIQGRPPIENYPYEEFNSAVVLNVSSTQSVDKTTFLNTVIRPVCALRKELIEFIKEKININ